MDGLYEKVSSLSISQQEEDNPKQTSILNRLTCGGQAEITVVKNNMECPICHQPASKTCSACKSVAYCCADHQKLDWKNHKKVCQPFIIKETEDMGMGWFATRDLKAGFILLEESPAIQAPAWKTLTTWRRNLTFTNEGRKCLTCGVKIHSTRTCSTCSWPVCSNSCEKNPVHMEYECKEFVSRKLKYPPPPSWQLGMFITCMRANGMKVRDPRKFNQLMALRDDNHIPSANQLLIQEYDLPAEQLEVFSGPNCLDHEEFRKLLRICKVNGFECEFAPPISHIGDGSVDDTMVVYLKVSRINHSCSPNCAGTFGSAPTNKIRICTAIPVSKGQQLTINYYDSTDTLPTTSRQLTISSLAGFTCRCKRCLDPTELGTFLSGIKCFRCSRHLKADSTSDDVGFLLPANALDLDSPDYIHECHRRHVNVPSTVLPLFVPAVVNNAIMHINEWTNPKSVDIKALETLLNQFDEGRDFKDHLHPNYWIIQAAMRLVITIQRNEIETMTIEDLKKRIRRVKYLLAIDEKLYPGIYKLRYQDLRFLIETIGFLITKFGPVLPVKEAAELFQDLGNAEKEELKFQNLEYS